MSSESLEAFQEKNAGWKSLTILGEFSCGFQLSWLTPVLGSNYSSSLVWAQDLKIFLFPEGWAALLGILARI